MKIIRNGICYVESEDIEFLENKPRGVLLERKAKVSYSTIFNFEKYVQEQSVLYFQENECIIDYNSICNLPNDELDSKIQEIEEQLNKYTSIYVSASLATKEKLDQSQEYNYGLKKLEHIFTDIYQAHGIESEGYFKIKAMEILYHIDQLTQNRGCDFKYFDKGQIESTKRIKEYLVGHLEDNISLEQLVKEEHINLSQFYTIFSHKFCTQLPDKNSGILLFVYNIFHHFQFFLLHHLLCP